MSQRSPFAFGRFEKTSRPSYFLHREIYQEVIRDAPTTIYLVGPRGTGKTTLLKALDWRERLYNPSLKEALDGEVFGSPAGNFLGVYLKVPEILLGVVEAWLESLDDQRRSLILGFYLDLVWLEAVCEGISELLALGHLEAGPERERIAVANIVKKFRTTFVSGSRSPRTVAELRSSLADLRVELERSAKIHGTYDAILAMDAVLQPGRFGRDVATLLEPLCRNSDEAEPWHFRICLDEAETLSRYQLLVLNSMVRGSGAPIFFVASFVSMPSQVHQTLLENLTLAATDREIVSFEKLVTKKRFREFAEGVATVRVREFLGDAHFDVSRSLGTLNVNGLLQRILERSVSPFSKALLRRAEELSRDPRFASVRSTESQIFNGELEEESGSEDLETLESDEGVEVDDFDSLEDFEELEYAAGDTLPIYQAYLIDELNLALPSEDAPWKRRRQSSAELRKRMVAAYLAICRRASTKPRYASARMVLGLSDSCIRDFLRFVDHIYRHSGGNLTQFLAGPVPVDNQDRALKEASKTKAEGIDASIVSSPREIGMMVRGIARITRILQTRSSQQQHLRSSERGIFSLKILDPVSDRSSRAYQQLIQASEAGFLRLKETHEFVRFRLHASLAPAYELSYRGAYYRSPVEWTDMELLSRAKTDAEVDALAMRIGRRLAGIEVLPLFPDLDDDPFL